MAEGLNYKLIIAGSWPHFKGPWWWSAQQTNGILSELAPFKSWDRLGLFWLRKAVNLFSLSLRLFLNNVS